MNIWRMIFISTMMLAVNIPIVHAQSLFDNILQWFKSAFFPAPSATPINNTTTPAQSNTCYTCLSVQDKLNLYINKINVPTGITNNVYANGFQLTGTFSQIIYVLPSVIVLRNGQKTYIQISCTDSMLPTLDCRAHEIVYIPQNPDEIHVGDIVAAKAFSYSVTNSNGVFVANNFMMHRVVSKSPDGTFCIRGDNLDYISYGSNCDIAFDDILFKVVGLIY